jgi:hypothetical protein
LCEYGKKPLEKKTENGGEKVKMNVKYKKSLKLVTLLISSIIIATVAAQSYSELFMYGQDVTIGTATVKFTAGDDTSTLGGGDAINTAGTTVTFDAITIAPGDTATYNEAVNITNSAGTTKTVTITVESVTGNFDTNFDYLNVTMIAADGSTKGNNIEVVSSGTNSTTTTGQTMSNGEVWAVRWILKAKATATLTETFSITMKVRID